MRHYNQRIRGKVNGRYQGNHATHQQRSFIRSQSVGLRSSLCRPSCYGGYNRLYDKPIWALVSAIFSGVVRCRCSYLALLSPHSQTPCWSDCFVTLRSACWQLLAFWYMVDVLYTERPDFGLFHPIRFSPRFALDRLCSEGQPE